MGTFLPSLSGDSCINKSAEIYGRTDGKAKKNLNESKTKTIFNQLVALGTYKFFKILDLLLHRKSVDSDQLTSDEVS